MVVAQPDLFKATAFAALTEKNWVRDLENIKIRDLRRIFGCSFRCNVGRIASYVTGVATEDTAKKTSKVRILIFSKALRWI